MSVATINNIGGVKLVDINPNKLLDSDNIISFGATSASGGQQYKSILPVSGYSICSVYPNLYSYGVGATWSYQWRYDDETYSSQTDLTSSTWNDLVIPNNAIAIVIRAVASKNTWVTGSYSLLT